MFYASVYKHYIFTGSGFQQYATVDITGRFQRSTDISQQNNVAGSVVTLVSNCSLQSLVVTPV